jgi:hypothetical protein
LLKEAAYISVNNKNIGSAAKNVEKSVVAKTSDDRKNGFKSVNFDNKNTESISK